MSLSGWAGFSAWTSWRIRFLMLSEATESPFDVADESQATVWALPTYAAEARSVVILVAA